MLLQSSRTTAFIDNIAQDRGGGLQSSGSILAFHGSTTVSGNSAEGKLCLTATQLNWKEVESMLS